MLAKFYIFCCCDFDCTLFVIGRGAGNRDMSRFNNKIIHRSLSVIFSIKKNNFNLCINPAISCQSAQVGKINKFADVNVKTTSSRSRNSTN